jgi:hypothetical protein
MARSIQTIQNEIQAIVASQSSLSALNLSPSQTSIYQLWENIMATELNIEEQLWDIYSAMLDQTIALAPIGTDQWVYQQVKNFQWDATTPQVVSVNPANGFTVGYNPVDVTKQIISQAAVITQPSRLVSVKVATGTPPGPLSTLQLQSLQAYLDEISFAGVQYITTSQPADLFLLNMDLYFNGQYAPTIQAVTNAAINTFIANIPFNGIFKLSSFEQAILAIPGVTDVDFQNVALSPSSGSYFYLVTNYTEVVPSYPLFSGYATPTSININYLPQ